MLDLRQRENLCLFLDIDGTLLEFASRPEDVRVPASLVETLVKLQSVLKGAFAFVTGRRIAEVDKLFAPLRTAASGVHGAELRAAPQSKITFDRSDLLPEQLHQRLLELSEQFPGTFVEDKTFALAVHYRKVPDAMPSLRKRIELIVAQQADASLTILSGHSVIEIKRKAYEKGMAIDLLMLQAPFDGRTPIFIGDDATDLPGFAAVLRSGGFAFSVGQKFTGLTGDFAAPQNVRDWLAEFADMQSALPQRKAFTKEQAK
jgi:trehalose 6-phosphate phosphatase